MCRSLLFLSCLLLSLGAAPAGGQEGGPWRADGEELQLAQRARELLNQARQAEGVPVLAGNDQLDLLAYQHSHEMAQRGNVTHHSYLFGINTETRVRTAFPRILQFAENVARNRDIEGLNLGLLESAGHRLNRLDSSFTHVGIGIARASENQLYLTEVFVRAADPALLKLETLYSALDPDDLPDEPPAHGQVISETVVIGPAGPDDPSYWTQRGIDAFTANRYEEAVEHFEDALALSPDYAYARFNLGRALLRAGRAADALDVLASHLSEAPDDIDAWSIRGSAALIAGDYPLAARSFRRVIDSREREAGPWYNLGLSLEYQGRLEEAESAYAQALHLDPQMQAARDALRRVRG